MSADLPFERRSVLGIPVDVVSEGDVLAYICDSVSSGRVVQIVTVNAEYVMRGRKNSDFRSIIELSDIATPDGAGILWALRRQGVRLPRRVGGSDLVWSVSEQAARCGHRLFLLGGDEGVAAAAADRLRKTYPELEVAGTFAGSPRVADEGGIVDLIRGARADILFVAFGAPQQDQWIARTSQSLGISVAMGVGGSLDYLAGTARRAPRWMQENGLEWLWRLVRQPRRWRRMIALPHFACLVLISGERERIGSD